ncbi:hypothetical protein F5Y18DRAFT_416666 [Xylariaceae sp. FL1019]|nr:hypothetical protein F5Y18DRAFT_416666 [Xylariaceae sp. FL1019]
MELLELVDHETTARPFQCDWPSCTKSFNRKSDLQRHYRIHTNERPFSCVTTGCGKSFIQRSALTVHIRTHTGEKPHQCQHIGCGKRFSDSSSLARHRRIHTGKRPYRCAHDGCLKSFCRKTTMVKHQRRSHQRGRLLSDQDDFSSESDRGESPDTPGHPGISWTPTPPPHLAPALDGHALQRAASFSGFGQQVEGYAIPLPFGHRPSVSSTGGQHEYHRTPLPQQTGIRILQRTLGMPQPPYFVTEQGNPGVATMNTHQIQPYQVPRQQPDNPLLNPYTTATMSEPIQSSSPSPFSPATTAQTPPANDNFYQHHPAQSNSYGAHAGTPGIEQHAIVQYPHQIQQAMGQAVSQVPPPEASHPIQDQFTYTTGHQGQHWFNEMSYQAPVDVATIGQLPAYGSGGYNAWEVKSEFDDPTMQMPSARIDSM